ncbi:hypothetical protein A2223_00900 [Candidatus Falkowbacteria bacterium RIFOXYA2_FULL_35_8]|nr:MAG: hypothetical protein A2223_00900 [Candidatus Falkowbacteria bacterium RIFOXYA2_FULL_35_8]
MSTRKDNDPTVPILRKVAGIVARGLAKTNITPNQITIGSFIVFVPLIFYFLIQGTWHGNLIGFALIIVTVIFDMCDGMVARLKNVSSTFGAWLDTNLDRVFQYLIFVAVIIGTWQKTGLTQVFIFGLFLLAGQAMADSMGFVYQQKFNFDIYAGSEIFKDKFKNIKVGIFDRFLKNIIVPYNLFIIFIFASRYLLTIGLITNQAEWFIYIFAITINIRWIFMFLLYVKFLATGESKLYTVKFLRELSSQNYAK